MPYNPSFQDEPIGPAPHPSGAPEPSVEAEAQGVRARAEGLTERMPIGWFPLPMTIMGLFVVAVFAGLIAAGLVGFVPGLAAAVLIVLVQVLAMRALRRDVDRFGRALEAIIASPVRG